MDIKHFQKQKSIIELNIEELVLNGFISDDREIIRNSIEIELNRLFTDTDQLSFRENISLENLDAGNITLWANSGIRDIGKQAANSIYNVIKKSLPMRNFS